MASRNLSSCFTARRRTVSLVSRSLPQLPTNEPCLTFVHLQGEETLGAEYAYDISARSQDNPLALAAVRNLNLQALVGTELGVTIELDGTGTGLSGGIGAGERYLSGVVTQARRLDSDARHITYQFRIEPWLVIAKHASNYRRFHGSTAPQIIEAVLSDYIFPVESRLSESYPVRDYQCQYGETDYDFVVRLMQEWGITHYWEHGLDCHRLVLVDGMGAFRRNDSAAYHTLHIYPPGVRIDEEHLNRFEIAETLRPGEWITSDYDFTRPNADLTTRNAAPRDTSHASFQRHEWPGDYLNAGDDDGGMRARIRMEALRCTGQRAHGSGNLRGVTTGTTFTLTGHPIASQNGEFLVTRSCTELRETGEESGATQSWLCHVEFEVQRTSEVFRPQRVLDKPRARGMVPATVVGPESAAEHWTDKYGRVKVQFPWDRVGTFDANSSPWMRVSYSNAGNGFGAMEVPRIGQEVMVAFYNDDPDCPVVLGCAYNALSMPPWELPAEAVLSGMRSKEVGGSRAGHLLFDDTQQRIQTQLSSDHLLSQINLGHIRRVSDQSGRKEKRGEGLEARTDGHAAVRAALGLLLTTFSRAHAEGDMMSVRDIVHQMQQALEVTATLADGADAAQAQAGEQKGIAQALRQQIAEIEGGGELEEFSAPHVVTASPAGVVSTAGTSTHIHSTEHTQLTTGKHFSISAGKSLFASVADSLRVMVHQGGMKWFARRGKVQIEAQDDAIELTARKGIQVISTDDWVEVMARKGIRLNVQGTEICLTQDGIQNITTGQWIVFAAEKDWGGAKRAAGEMPTLPVTGRHQEFVVLRDADTGRPLANYPYQITTPDGAILTGRSDATGKTSVIRTDEPQTVHAEPLPNPDLLEIIEGCYWDQSTAYSLDFVKHRKTI